MPQTEEARRAYRELLVTAPGLGARFAKWRAVIGVGDGLPGAASMEREPALQMAS